jgi:7,8-dihydropterin-6-yl-methyl-4-(beta-D-ribofuranosyl)aminobenzene 5'-phosphate synthase
MRVYVLVGGAPRKGFEHKRGLSIGVEYKGLYIVFDAGPDAYVIANNAGMSGFPLDLVDHVVISHAHAPHIGGLEAIGWEAPFAKVYLPYASMETLGRQAQKWQLSPVEVVKETRVVDGVVVSRPFHGPPWEHFMLVELEGGRGEYALFTGCFHPGVREVLADISTRYRVTTVIGGFHLEAAPPETVRRFAEDIALKLRAERVYPLHCSGSLVGELLSERFKLDVRYLRTGDVVDL